MVAGLGAADVRFVVIGGVAGVAHGSVRVTVDLDICYDTAPENRESLARLLARWNAYPREIEPGLPFIMDPRTLRDSQMLTLTTDLGPLDLFQLVPGVGDYARCRAGAVLVGVDKTEFMALDLPALIAAKRAAGRTRDLEHLRELEALLELRDRGEEE